MKKTLKLIGGIVVLFLAVLPLAGTPIEGDIGRAIGRYGFLLVFGPVGVALIYSALRPKR